MKWLDGSPAWLQKIPVLRDFSRFEFAIYFFLILVIVAWFWFGKP